MTLDRLRALHQEVGFAWRRYNYPSISEGEAEILNMGFILLERMVERYYEVSETNMPSPREDAEFMTQYVNRVHAQFDYDADIKITGP